MHKRLFIPTLLLILLLVAACDPMAPFPTPTSAVIIVTAEPSRTPTPTATSALTRTPTLTPTPQATATFTPYPCSETAGQIIPFDQNRSTIAGEFLRYRVYIPPCYLDSQKRYPVTFLLPEGDGTETQWDEIGLDEALDQGIRLGAIAPMLVVMPNMGVLGRRNAFPDDPSYERVMMEELLPAIDRDFCTWSDRDHRALGGIGRGGFWAFSIGLRHPDVFSILGAHSAEFSTDNAPPAFNPLDLASNSQFIADVDMRLYLDNGASDDAGANLQLFSTRLTSRGISHTYVINPVGGHDEEYWSAHVSEYIEFYARDWTRNISELPSCLEASP
jgi:enterochelin esterase-like enzyme